MFCIDRSIGRGNLALYQDRLRTAAHSRSLGMTTIVPFGCAKTGLRCSCCRRFTACRLNTWRRTLWSAPVRDAPLFVLFSDAACPEPVLENHRFSSEKHGFQFKKKLERWCCCRGRVLQAHPCSRAACDAGRQVRVHLEPRPRYDRRLLCRRNHRPAHPHPAAGERRCGKTTPCCFADILHVIVCPEPVLANHRPIP